MNRLIKYRMMAPSELQKQHEKALQGNFTVTGSKRLYITLADIGRATVKDVVDTFKPYKSHKQRYGDRLQVLYGLENLFVGVVGFVFAIFYALIALPYYAYQNYQGNFNGSILLTYFKNIAGITISAAANALRGATQIATVPLTLLRMPLRMIITKYQGEPLIENSESLQKLAAMAARNDAAGISDLVIHRTLAHKCMKAALEGQKTHIVEIRDCALRDRRINYQIFLKPNGASVAPAADNNASSALSMQI